MKKIAAWIKSFWTHSIQRQLMLGITLVHAVLMTIFVMDLVSRQKQFLNTQIGEHTEALAITLAANSVSWVLADDVMGLEEVVRSIKDYPDIEYAMILSKRGKVLAHTDNTRVGFYIKDPVSLSLLNGNVSARPLVNNVDLLDIAVPINSHGQLIGWSRVAVSHKSLTTGLKKIQRDGLGYTVLAILVGSFFAFFMAQGITSCIRQLLKVMHQVENGDINIRIDSKRSDELGRLAVSFDNMIERVRQSIWDLEASRKTAMEERDRAEKYLNTAMIAFLGLNKNGEIELANPHCQDILNCREQDLLGKNWFETFIPEHERNNIRELFEATLQNKSRTGSSFECGALTSTGEIRILEWRDTLLYDSNGQMNVVLWSGVDVTDKKQNEAELEKYRKHLEDLVKERTMKLEIAIENIKTLKGIIPICSHCKKIRDDNGYWNQLEAYMAQHSEADFSHGICPECAKELYPDFDIYNNEPTS